MSQGVLQTWRSDGAARYALDILIEERLIQRLHIHPLAVLAFWDNINSERCQILGNRKTMTIHYVDFPRLEKDWLQEDSRSFAIWLIMKTSWLMHLRVLITLRQKRNWRSSLGNLLVKILRENEDCLLPSILDLLQIRFIMKTSRAISV